ncbi:MAG: ATP-binding protein, partial [Succinivibrio sp.]
SVQAVIDRSGAELETDIGDRPMPILGNATALSGAVSNLVANAVEAGAKKVKISFKKENGEIAISVANDGPAIPDEIRSRICEPFFTTKSNGTGLGLAVAEAVARVHHGRLTLSSLPGFNVVFSLCIPEYDREESPSPSEIAAQGSAA